MDNGEQQLLTPAQVAEIFQVSVRRVRQWVNDGDLPGVRTPGGRGAIRIRRSDVDAIVEAASPKVREAS